MSARKRIVLLGATGSIGENTLAVIRKHPDRFRLIGAAANSNAAQLAEIAREHDVTHTTLYEESGAEGLLSLATLPEADVVIVATTGTVAVRPVIAALQAGKTVGLANKETLVMAGAFVMETARSAPGQLLPVDSEHNAIFQCLEGRKAPSELKRILLTASGGPFLHHTRAELEGVTVADALRHPNWDMGPKVTIDSATMANKGLEMIEAHWLFGVPASQIEVVIHPQSLLHSMVEFVDGSVIAQMAPPSMTFPIQHVLSWPERLEASVPGMDFSRIHRLELRPPDLEKFPALRLAREALETGGLAPVVYNAANEMAVQAFLEEKLGFLDIPRFIGQCLQNHTFPTPSTLETLLALEPAIADFTRAELEQMTR